MNRNIIILNNYDDVHKSGVYILEHKSKTGLLYVGSTGIFNERKGKIGFARRFSNHINDIKNKKHSAKYLQNICTKYGIDGLFMKIVEITTPDQAIIREQFYIETLKPRLNTNKIATSCLGIKRSIETRNKLSKILKGRKITEEQSRQRSERMKGIRPKHFHILHTPEANKKRSEKLKGKKVSEAQIKALSIAVYKLSLSGEMVEEFPSMSEAARKTNTAFSTINKCAWGKRRSAGCFKWAIKNGYSESRLTNENK
jgi:group I intron endonuclease